MTKRDRLLAMIRENPAAVRFSDACKAAVLLEFVHEGGVGSHRVFKRSGEWLQLNFQDRKRYIPVYQARQLLAMINRYGDGA